MQTARRERMTEAQYLELERQSEVKHEFIDGEMWAMAGGTPRHAIICGQVQAALAQRLPEGCISAPSDLRVNVPAVKEYVYPDLSVVCGDLEYSDSDANSVVNPCAIFEVLSASTEAYDRGLKFRLYQGIETLKEYVLVSQSEPFVDCISKIDGEWVYRTYQGMEATLILPNLGVSIPLSEIYRNYERYRGDKPGRPSPSAGEG